MRVLHILCDLNGGGAERLVLELCQRTTHDAEVITILPGGDLTDAYAQAGVRVRWAGRHRKRPGVRAVARIAAWSSDYDIIHTHLWASDVWGRIGARLGSRCPVVTTEHNARPDSSARGVLWRQLAPLSDVIVCVSEPARQALAASGVAPRRLTVIENGIPLQRFSLLPPTVEPRRRILAIGRLTRQKGFDVLIQAIRTAPGLELDILGDGPDRAALTRQAAGCAGRVRLHGWVQDIRDFLQGADVVAIPSRWEGFGLVAVEAMASGRPVVASRVDGLVDVVGDAGVLIPPDNADALADALCRVCGAPEHWEALRAAGLVHARRFDVQRTAAAYDQLYERLCDPERHSL